MWSKLNVRSALERLGDVVAPPAADDDDDEEDEDDDEEDNEEEYEAEEGDDGEDGGGGFGQHRNGGGGSGPFGLVGMLTRALDKEQQHYNESHHPDNEEDDTTDLHEIQYKYDPQQDEAYIPQQESTVLEKDDDVFHHPVVAAQGGMGSSVYATQAAAAAGQDRGHHHHQQQQQPHDLVHGTRPLQTLTDDWDDEIYPHQQQQLQQHPTVAPGGDDDPFMSDIPISQDAAATEAAALPIAAETTQPSPAPRSTTVPDALSQVDQHRRMPVQSSLADDDTPVAATTMHRHTIPDAEISKQHRQDGSENNTNNDDDDDDRNLSESARRHSASVQILPAQQMLIREKGSLSPNPINPMKITSSTASFASMKISLESTGSSTDSLDVLTDQSSRGTQQRRHQYNHDDDDNDNAAALCSEEIPSEVNMENDTLAERRTITVRSETQQQQQQLGYPAKNGRAVEPATVIGFHDEDRSGVTSSWPSVASAPKENMVTSMIHDGASVIVSPLSSRTKEFQRPTVNAPGPVDGTQSPEQQQQHPPQQSPQARRANPPARPRKHEQHHHHHEAGGPPRADSLLFLDTMKSKTTDATTADDKIALRDNDPSSTLVDTPSPHHSHHPHVPAAAETMPRHDASALADHPAHTVGAPLVQPQPPRSNGGNPEPTTGDHEPSSSTTQGEDNNSNKSREQKRYRRRPGPPKADSMLFLQTVPPKEVVAGAEEDAEISLHPPSQRQQKQGQVHEHRETEPTSVAGPTDVLFGHDPSGGKAGQQPETASAATAQSVEELEERCRELQLRLSQAEAHIVALQQRAASQMEKDEVDHDLLVRKFQEKETFMLKAIAEEHEYEKGMIRQELSQKIEELQAKLNMETATHHREKDQLERLLREANHRIELVEKEAQSKLKKADAASAQSHQQHDRALRMAEDKLAQSKAKIDERDEQIQNLKAKIHGLESKMSEQESGVHEAEEELEELHNENESLRRHADEVEQECALLRSRVSELQAEVDSVGGLKMELRIVKEERDRERTKTESVAASAESNTTHLESQRDAALSQANDLKQQLAAALADVQVLRTDMNRLMLANANLQNALEAFQSEREAELALTEEQRLASELGAATAHAAALEATHEAHRAEIAQIQLEADSKMREAKEATRRLELKLEQYRVDNVQMRRSLDEAIRRLQTTQEDVIDRTLMKNILLDWLTKTGAKERGQVLEVMASVLHFSYEEKERVHIHGGSLTFGQVVGAVAAPLPATKADLEHLEGNNVQEKWVNFLLSETDD